MAQAEALMKSMRYCMPVMPRCSSDQQSENIYFPCMPIKPIAFLNAFPTIIKPTEAAHIAARRTTQRTKYDQNLSILMILVF